MKPVYEIEGKNFSTLEEFANEFSGKLKLQIQWNGNLDAFNDILHGGFGTPDEGFILIWKSSAISKERLGFDETIRQLKIRLLNCNPANKQYVESELEKAVQHQSSTVFDWLVDIIKNEEHADVELRFE